MPNDFRRQDKHLVELQEKEVLSAEVWDQTLDDITPINEIRYLATHNSYRTQARPLQFFFLNLGEPGGSATLEYSHLPFIDQFNLGIRSLELDLRYKRGAFENCHVPLVDNRSHSPAMIQTLQERCLLLGILKLIPDTSYELELIQIVWLLKNRRMPYQFRSTNCFDGFSHELHRN